MLDPAACAGMELGTPRVAVAALAELHRLLVEHGFRRSSSDGPTIVQEERHEKHTGIGAALHTVQRQLNKLNIPFDSARLGGVSSAERRISLARMVSPFLKLPASPLERVTMVSADVLPLAVLKRKAVVYIRQST